MTTTTNNTDRGFTHEQRIFLCEVANKLGGSGKIKDEGSWLQVKVLLPNTLGLSIVWSETTGFAGTYSGTGTCEIAALKNGEVAYGPHWRSGVRGWQSFDEACAAILELLLARPDEFGWHS